MSMNKIMHISKKSSQEDVKKMVGVDTTSTLAVSYNGTAYEVESHRIIVGYKWLTKFDDVFKRDSKSYELIDIYSKYFFLYDRNKKVLYWGMFQDFLKSEDAIVEGIGKLLQENHPDFIK